MSIQSERLRKQCYLRPGNISKDIYNRWHEKKKKKKGLNWGLKVFSVGYNTIKTSNVLHIHSDQTMFGFI